MLRQSGRAVMSGIMLVLIAGCATKADVEAVRSEVVKVQNMTQSLQQSTAAAATEARRAAENANAAAEEARKAARSAEAAAAEAKAASEIAEKVFQASLRK